MICEELKIACTVQMRRFDTLLTSLAENRGDAVMASIAVTPEARKRADFSDPYYRTPARFVARRDVVMNDVRPEQLEGKKIAVVAGTAHEAYLKALFTEARPAHLSPPPELARDALRRGDVDLLFGDGISLAFWLNGTDSAELLRVSRRAVHREPLFRRGRRHRGQARQRHAAAGVQLGAVPACGKRAASATCGCAIFRSARSDPSDCRRSVTESLSRAVPRLSSPRASRNVAPTAGARDLA